MAEIIKILGIQACFRCTRSGAGFLAPVNTVQIEENEWAKLEKRDFVIDDEDPYGEALLENLEAGLVPRSSLGTLMYTRDDVLYKRVILKWANWNGDYWIYRKHEEGSDIELIESNTSFQEDYESRLPRR